MTDELARKGLSGILNLGGNAPKPQTSKPGTWSGTRRAQEPLSDFRSGGDLFDRWPRVRPNADDDLDIPGFLDRRTSASHVRPMSDDIRHLSEDDGREDEGRQEWRVGRLGARHFETSLPQCKARFNSDNSVRLIDHDEMCALADAGAVVLMDILSAQGFRLSANSIKSVKILMHDLYETVLGDADHHDQDTGELLPVALEEDTGD